MDFYKKMSFKELVSIAKSYVHLAAIKVWWILQEYMDCVDINSEQIVMYPLGEWLDVSDWPDFIDTSDLEELAEETHAVVVSICFETTKPISICRFRKKLFKEEQNKRIKLIDLSETFVHNKKSKYKKVHTYIFRFIV